MLSEGVEKWYISIEKTCVTGPYGNLANGLAAVFTSYYVFNMRYPAEAASTLECIQRYV